MRLCEFSSECISKSYMQFKHSPEETRFCKKKNYKGKKTNTLWIIHKMTSSPQRALSSTLTGPGAPEMFQAILK